MLRFSLASVLAVVFFVAVGSTALANVTDLWRQITVTLTVICLLLATLAAVFSQGRTRLFAGGFALTGWLYMTLAFVSAFGLRDDLLTDRAIQRLGRTIQRDNLGAGVGNALLDFDNDGSLDLFVSTGGGTFIQQPSPFPNLTAIGHALWTVIIGWMGGIFALWLHQRARTMVGER